MHARLTLLILLATAASSCQGEEFRLIASYPEETRWVGALFFDQEDRFLSASGLSEYQSSSAAKLKLPLDGSEVGRIQVLAYAEGQLQTQHNPQTLLNSSLRPAALHDPVLPAPFWSAETTDFSGSTALASKDAGDLRLTADWLPRCPQVIPEGKSALVDLRCAPYPCEVQPVQDGCNITIDLQACGFSTFNVEIDGRGEGIVDGNFAGTNCQSVTSPRGVVYSVACGDCRTDLYLPGDSSKPPFTFEKQAVLQVEPQSQGKLTGDHYGFLSALTLTREFAVVADWGGGYGKGSCSSGSRMSFYNQVTMELSHTATVSFCISQLDANSSSEENAVWATGFKRSAPGHFDNYLFKFSKTGEELIRIPLNWDTSSTDALLISRDETRAAVTFPDDGGRKGHLYFHELPSGSIVKDLAVDSPTSALLQNDSQTMILGQDGLLESFVLKTGARGPPLSVSTGEGVNNGGDLLLQLPQSDLIVVGSRSDRSGVHIVNGVTIAAVGLHFERYAVVSGLAAWEEEETRVLAGMVAHAEGEQGFVTLVERDARFSPVAYPITRGPLVQMRTDPRKHIWFIAPWTGELIRLRPNYLIQ